MNKVAGSCCLILVAAISVSCGSEEKGAPDYFPLSVGDSWEYVETYDDTSHLPENTSHEVSAIETLTTWDGPEVETFVVLNRPNLETDEVRTYYLEDTGDQILRHRQKVDHAGDGVDWKQQDYVPGLLKFDRTQATPGATWTSETMRHTTGGATDGESKYIKHEWTILSNTESVNVPAGVFDNCLVVERIDANDPADSDKKIYYFAPGIGKVKEVTEGLKTEELSAYSVNSAD